MLLGNNFGKENSYIIIHDLIVFRQITPNINDRINVKLREYQSIINSSIKVTSILDIPVWLKKKSASNTCITLESRSDEEKKEKSQNHFDILVFPDKDIIFEKDYIKQYETLIRCPSETI